MLVCDTLTCRQLNKPHMTLKHMFNNIDSFPLQIFFFYWVPSLSYLHDHPTNSMNQRSWRSYMSPEALLFWLSWLLSAADLTPGTCSLICEPLPASLRQRSDLTATSAVLSLGFPAQNPLPLTHSPHCSHDDLSEEQVLTVQDFLVNMLSLVALWPSEHSLAPGAGHGAPSLARAGPRHSWPHSGSYRMSFS